MGWTVYHGLNAEESKAYELSNTEVLKRSGNWYIFRTTSGHVGLVHFLTSRGSDGVAIKGVTIEMGPGHVPPRAIAKAYVDLYDGDIDKAGGTYGAPLLREALEPKASASKIEAGDRFTLDGAGNWTDGRPLAGAYTFLGKYRALRYDGVRVRLARTWRARAVKLEAVSA